MIQSPYNPLAFTLVATGTLTLEAIDALFTGKYDPLSMVTHQRTTSGVPNSCEVDQTPSMCATFFVCEDSRGDQPSAPYQCHGWKQLLLLRQ